MRAQSRQQHRDNNVQCECLFLSDESGAKVLRPPPATQAIPSAVGSGAAGNPGCADRPGSPSRRHPPRCSGANLAQPLLVLSRELPASGHHFLDHFKGLSSRLGLGRKHRRKRSKGCILIDQQHEVLLAHERLEFRKRHISISSAKATHSLKSTWVNGTPTHAGVDEGANDGFAQSAESVCAISARRSVSAAAP